MTWLPENKKISFVISLFNAVLPQLNSCISFVQISRAISPSPVCKLKVKCPSQSSINDKRVRHIDLPSQI